MTLALTPPCPKEHNRSVILVNNIHGIGVMCQAVRALPGLILLLSFQKVVILFALKSTISPFVRLRGTSPWTSSVLCLIPEIRNKFRGSSAVEQETVNIYVLGHNRVNHYA